MFGHGEDLGGAAYTEDGAEPACAAAAGDCGQARHKKARTSRQEAGEVVASLEGLEACLGVLGERPRFAVAQPCQLQHVCSTAEAGVNFWPNSLRWNVEGRRSFLVEAALLAPLAPPSTAS